MGADEEVHRLDDALSEMLWTSSSSFLRRPHYDDPMISRTDSATSTYLHGNIPYRSLTYLDTDDADIQENGTISDVGLVIGFSILSAVFLLVMVVAIRISSTCHAFYEWNAIRLLLPALAFFLCLETATLAVQASLSTVNGPWAVAVFMVSSTIAPGIFLFSFVITFLAYRTRSMPFCFVYRGPGRQVTAEPWRDDDEEVFQPLVRPAVLVVAIRLFALGLLILNLIVNFDVVWAEQDLAGRTGWATVVSDPSNPSIDHIILALVPMALVSLLCLYFSLLLWRYGCELSLVIYSSGIVNPWLAPVFGSTAMLAGQMFGPDLFLITSNGGILIYMLSMIRVLYEARRDLEVSGDLGQFLDALGNDKVTRTQNGVEKYAQGDEDTLSSGQHQQWMLNESNNEVYLASASSVQDSEVPKRIPSYASQNSATSSRRRTPSIKKSNLKAPPPNLEPPEEESPEPCNSKNDDGAHRIFDGSSGAPPMSVSNRPSDDDDPSDSVNPGADFVAQRVQGISGQPEKLRRGQRPKGKYLVY